MNYGQMRDYILQLINRYSIAGAKYALSYNNQQDYVNKIPGLINDGLIYIASSIRKLPAQKVYLPEDGEVYGNYIRHAYPNDCIEISSGGLLLPNSSGRRYLTEYIIQEPDHILLPAWLKDEAVLEYFREPKLLSADPADDASLDAALDVQLAICYYVAAHLVQFDDSYIYTSLYNEFESRAERLIQAPTTEIRRTYDVYGFGMGDVYG